MDHVLKDNLPHWQEIGTSSVVLDWISNGVTLPFTSVPPEFDHYNREFTVKESTFLDEEIEKLCKLGCVKVCISAQDYPHYFAYLGMP